MHACPRGDAARRGRPESRPNLLTDYRAVLIEGVGHYPMLEKPTEFNEKLREALKEFAPGK